MEDWGTPDYGSGFRIVGDGAARFDGEPRRGGQTLTERLSQKLRAQGGPVAGELVEVRFSYLGPMPGYVSDTFSNGLFQVQLGMQEVYSNREVFPGPLAALLLSDVTFTLYESAGPPSSFVVDDVSVVGVYCDITGAD